MVKRSPSHDDTAILASPGSSSPVENAMVHWDLRCYDHVELCREASPIGHVDKADTPTLILQGE